MSDLLSRFWTGLILVPSMLLVVLWGGIIYAALLCAGFVMCSAELWRMVSKDEKHQNVLAVSGIFYMLPAFLGLFYLRFEENGMLFTLLLFAIVWISDISAYLIGKMIGGQKIVPLVSPHKTWSGFWGAVFVPVVFLLVFPVFNTIESMILASLAGFACQVGDFTVSLLKRHVGVKDTGTLLPGHGGLLDRVDSLILATPVFIITLKIFGY